MKKSPILTSLLLLCSSAAAAIDSYQRFPAVPTEAQAGETVLVPSYNWIEAGAGPEAGKTTFIFYHQTLVSAGPAESVVKFMRDQHAVPNSYIVRLAPGARAKLGDIVLTWWQSGSGMQRAIVVAADDPTRPVVRYLDIAYDNPAKSRDKSTTIGQMDEALAPDTFTPLAEGAPGSIFRCTDGARPGRWQLISSAADGQQLMRGFSGRLQVFAKGQCTPTPLKPSLKIGQRVAVEFAGGFTEATIDRLDERNGRVFVTLFNKERAVAYGDVMP